MATVTVRIHDDGGQGNGGVDTSAAQTFAITVTAVNDVPSFTKGSDATVLEDSGLLSLADWATELLAGPSDEVAQSLSFIVTNDDNSLFAVQPAIAADGSLTFTPAANANGSATITVRIHDDGGTENGGVDTSATQTFTITVTAVNDAPSFTKGSNVAVLEDCGLWTVNNWATALSAGPADEAAQLLSFIVTNDTNGLFAVQPAISDDGTLTFTPAANANGSATVTVRIHDDGGQINGGIDTSGTQTFTITVAAVNDGPGFTKGSDATVLEDSGLWTLADWATELLAGAGDEVGQLLSFIVTNDNNGLFAVQPAIAADGTLTFTPAANANGVATVTVRIHDDAGTENGGVDTSATQTFTITVTAVNDQPSFTKGSDVTALEDCGLWTIANWATALLAGPSNEAGQHFAFTITGNSNTALFKVAPAVAPDGTLTFTPADDANGTATITVEMYDDGGTAGGGVDTSAAQTFTIIVTAVNDVPGFAKGADVTALEDCGPQAFANWATALSAGPSDEAAQLLSFIVSNNNNGLFAVQPAIAADGKLTFTPASNANGTTTVTVHIHDDGGTVNGGTDTSGTQTFTITVTAVDDVPSFTKGSDATVLEDSGLLSVANWATALSAGPSNEAAQLLSFIVTNSNNAMFAVQPAVAPDGTLTFTPAANANGSATITVRIHDGGGTADGGVDTSATQTFTIAVTAVNDAPSFNGSDPTVLEDCGPQTLTNWATARLPGPADEAGQSLWFTITNDNNGMFVVQPAISDDGTLTFTTVANAYGVAVLSVVIHDDGGQANGGSNASAPVSFTLTVTGVNDAPTTQDQSGRTDRDKPYNGALTATDLANENETLTFAVVTDVAHGNLDLHPDGTFTYTPATRYCGSDTFTFSVSDGEASVQATFSLSIFYRTTLPPSGILVYKDDNLETVTLSLKNGGTADLYFGGDGNYDLWKIVITQTNAKSALSITTTGTTTLGILDASAGPLASITAITTTLYESLTIGTAPASKPASTVTISLGPIRDASITSGMAIKTFSALEWLDTGDPDTLTAPSIGTLNITGRAATTKLTAVPGNFQADLKLNQLAAAIQGLGTLNVAGTIDQSIIDVRGQDSAGKSINTFTAGAVATATVQTAGGIGSIATGVWVDGLIEAAWVGKLTTTAKVAKGWDGSFGPDLTLFTAVRGKGLGSATIAGAVTGGLWNVIGGGTGAITAASFANWELDTHDAVTSITGKGNFAATLKLNQSNGAAQALGTLSVSGNIDDTTMNLDGQGATGKSLGTFKAGHVGAMSVTADGGIGPISSGGWDGGEISAAWLTSLTTTSTASIAGRDGNFAAKLTLSGNNKGAALGSATLVGVASGDWSLTNGTAGAVKAGSYAPTWSLDCSGAATGVTSTKGAISGWIHAASLKALTAKTDLVDATVTLTAGLSAATKSLGGLTVTGKMLRSQILANGSTGTLSVGAMIDSIILTGLADTNADGMGDTRNVNGDLVADLPQTADLAAPLPVSNLKATIKALAVKGIKDAQGKPVDSFVNSNIAAGGIGVVSLNYAKFDNDGDPAQQLVPFGFAAHVITSIRYTDAVSTNGFTWRSGQGLPSVLAGTDLAIRIG